MGHAGASGKSPNDALWEMLSLRLSRPISATLLYDSYFVMEIRRKKRIR